jgi:hypothetical protein
LKVLNSCAIPCKLRLFSIFNRLLYEVKTFLWHMTCQWTALILSLANWASKFILRCWWRGHNEVGTASKIIEIAWH